jgi:hypothetical protein
MEKTKTTTLKLGRLPSFNCKEITSKYSCKILERKVQHDIYTVRLSYGEILF